MQIGAVPVVRKILLGTEEQGLSTTQGTRSYESQKSKYLQSWQIKDNTYIIYYNHNKLKKYNISNLKK